MTENDTDTHDNPDWIEEAIAEDPEWQERRARYDELAPQIKGAWGERALALFYEGEACEWWAELDSSQLVQAWPEFFDDPVLKVNHHQTIANQIRVEQDSDDHELRIVPWDETPFPDDPKAWDLV